MPNMLQLALMYVVEGDYFWASMGLTTIIGMFVGTSLYNGDFAEARKTMIILASYVVLILVTNVTRIMATITNVAPENAHMPFAGIMTVLMVTLFYVWGMALGVLLTKYARKGVIDNGH